MIYILIILLLDIALNHDICELYTSPNSIYYYYLLEVAKPFINPVFDRDYCYSPPNSKFLPIRAGTYSSNQKSIFEVIRVKKYKSFKPSTYSNFKEKKYNLIFYIMVLQSTVISINTQTTSYIKLSMNDNKLTSISAAKNNILKLRLRNNWNQVRYFNLKGLNNYMIKIFSSVNITLNAFIPWNIDLPFNCHQKDKEAAKNIFEIKGLKIRLNFTYGRIKAVNKLKDCLNSVKPINNITYSSNFSDNENIITIYHSQSDVNTIMLYRILLNRYISKKCIEMTCINWIYKTKTQILNNSVLKSSVSLIKKLNINKCSEINNSNFTSYISTNVSCILYEKGLNISNVDIKFLITGTDSSLNNISKCIQKIFLDKRNLNLNYKHIPNIFNKYQLFEILSNSSNKLNNDFIDKFNRCFSPVCKICYAKEKIKRENTLFFTIGLSSLSLLFLFCCKFSKHKFKEKTLSENIDDTQIKTECTNANTKMYITNLVLNSTPAYFKNAKKTGCSYNTPIEDTFEIIKDITVDPSLQYFELL